MKVVFLDIDGVLNTDSTPCPPYEEQRILIPVEAPCIARLNRLLGETGAKVVISSSWRKVVSYDQLIPALAAHGVVADVIGETPDLVNDAPWLEAWRQREGAPIVYERIARGMEIAEWLRRNAQLNVASFVILDDVADMWTLKDRLVLTDSLVGLDDPDVERAKCILDLAWQPPPEPPSSRRWLP